MTKKCVYVISAGLLAGVCLVLVLVCQFTTYLGRDGLPKGVIIAWHKDKVLTSGRIMPATWMFLGHVSPYEFVQVSNTIILYPRDVMPFFEKIGGTSLRIIVSNHPLQKEKIYLVDETSGLLIPIDDGGFDLSTVGSNIIGYGNSRGKIAYDPVSQTIRMTGEYVETTVGIAQRKVLDVHYIK